MFEIMQKLVAFKYSCKLNHWGTSNYSHHLLFDRLQEDIDDFVDSIAEKYFMSSKKSSQLSSSILNDDYIESDLIKSISNIMTLIEAELKKGDLTIGAESLLGSLCEALCEKRALLTMK